jgi:hypothetical protein
MNEIDDDTTKSHFSETLLSWLKSLSQFAYPERLNIVELDKHLATDAYHNYRNASLPFFPFLTK